MISPLLRTRRIAAIAMMAALMMAGALQTHASRAITVPGLCRSGLGTQVVKVEVKDAQGRLRTEVVPSVAVVKSPSWSPNDAEREGASEFEILISIAQLLETTPLAGVVGVGNRNGAFLPAAEQALARTVAMGLPVVKLSADGALPVIPDNLYIEAGSLSPEEARHTLAECLLTLGTLPPARDILNPTRQELAAIHAKLARYQLIFDAKAAATSVALR